jgi:hypothetical protein
MAGCPLPILKKDHRVSLQYVALSLWAEPTWARNKRKHHHALRELLFSAFSGEALSVRQRRIRVGLAQVSYFFSFFFYFLLFLFEKDSKTALELI